MTNLKAVLSASRLPGQAANARVLGKSARSKRLGLSLAEAGLVLGLGMFAFAVAYGFYKSGTNNINAQSQITGTVSLVSNIDRAFRSAEYYTDVTTVNVTNGGIVPESFRVVGTTIKHGWGGELSISPVAPAATADGYDLVYGDMPQESCVEFVSGAEGVARSIQVGTTLVKQPGTGLAVGTLTTACNGLSGDITLRIKSSSTTF